MNLNDLNSKALTDLVNHAIDKMNDGVGVDVYACDLHNKLYNMDYFIIGYYNAKQWIKECDLDAFEIIETVIDYENSNFGAVNTKINSESIVNMFAYIMGEEILNECEHLQKVWDNRLTKKDCKIIIKQLKAIIK